MKKQITQPKYQLKSGIKWLSKSVSVAVAYALLVNIPAIVSRSDRYHVLDLGVLSKKQGF
ncbi:hypothetical protein [Iningainema tapete]|uniref:Uncharacterized protein n=1 Tax=Iningainema tapete BLCC-T55 TaxID=2748662 RepID=A0A8J6XKJ9_9CYAN|nr:hypothetical protein [Iningainema tapete]MBD2776378.1 hypothetical protein [Iningainema tapete BLCC-T55]